MPQVTICRNCVIGINGTLALRSIQRCKNEVCTNMVCNQCQKEVGIKYAIDHFVLFSGMRAMCRDAIINRDFNIRSTFFASCRGIPHTCQCKNLRDQAALLSADYHISYLSEVYIKIELFGYSLNIVPRSCDILDGSYSKLNGPTGRLSLDYSTDSSYSVE
jgi:hypothetical protein